MSCEEDFIRLISQFSHNCNCTRETRERERDEGGRTELCFLPHQYLIFSNSNTCDASTNHFHAPHISRLKSSGSQRRQREILKDLHFMRGRFHFVSSFTHELSAPYKLDLNVQFHLGLRGTLFFFFWSHIDFSPLVTADKILTTSQRHCKACVM